MADENLMYSTEQGTKHHNLYVTFLNTDIIITTPYKDGEPDEPTVKMSPVKKNENKSENSKKTWR